MDQLASAGAGASEDAGWGLWLGDGLQLLQPRVDDGLLPLDEGLHDNVGTAAGAADAAAAATAATACLYRA